MENKPRILIVDDEPGIVESLALTFEEDYEVLSATEPEKAIELMKQNDVAVVLADQRMPRITGVEVLRFARELRPDAVRIVLSGYTDIEDLITAINAGEVWRYLTKPWEPADLKITVKQAAERFHLVRENQRLVKDLAAAHEKLKDEYESLKKAARDKYSFSEIVGKSPAMLKVFALLEKVSDSTVTVMVLGETGTGKELVAKAIHFNSARRDRKFLAQNCGALTDSLLESELFGHKKGAFTGAVADKKGLFEEADGGTVFLDEIAETSPAMQIRLLRVLQEGEVKRIGENEQHKVDVRVIAATNKDLEQYVKEGKFREDLYYRLSVIPISIPPLRERTEDMPLLAHHFLDRACRKFGRTVTRIGDDAMRYLEAYAFPGNVRELENEIERAVMLAEGDALTAESLSPRIRESTAHEIAARAEGGSLMDAVDRLKRRMIQAALAAEAGNKTKAAERVGLTRQSLQQMMRRLNME
jgi:two-component system response regulator HupR/HoxA